MCAGGHGIYKDSIDYSVFSGDWLIGRIYERKGFPDDPACGGWIDCSDLGQVFEHEAPCVVAFSAENRKFTFPENALIATTAAP